MSEREKKPMWYTLYFCGCKSEGYRTKDEVPDRCAEHDSRARQPWEDSGRKSPATISSFRGLSRRPESAAFDDDARGRRW